MTDFAKRIAEIVKLNDDKLVGKTRLQKTAYFLESYNVGYGFDFNYHYYGPYSESLAIAVEDAKALDLVDVDWAVSQSGMPYAVYANARLDESEQQDAELTERRCAILKKLDNYDAVVLELAATADFLAKNGYDDDPWAETLMRKAAKVTGDRVGKARKLLEELNT